MENVNVKNTPLQKKNDEIEIDLRDLYPLLVLNWQWFVLSILLCLGIAFVYLRYTTPIYQASAKLLIKEDENSYNHSSKNLLANMSNLGLISNSTGIDNEMEILKSSTISEDAIKDLKLHTMYYIGGRVKYRLAYQTQPINAVISEEGLNNIESPVFIKVKYSDGKYLVEGEYYPPLPKDERVDKVEKIEFEQTSSSLPIKINTVYGIITLEQNEKLYMEDGDKIKIVIYSPKLLSIDYAEALKVETSSQNTTIAVLSLQDASAQRAIDYIDALVEAYNRQANVDKNEIALRTEDFINGRLEKIGDELGNTDSSIEQLKRSNRVIELELSASETMKNSSEYDQKLLDINTQIELINNLSAYLNDDSNKYQVIPSNIGLTDQSTTSLINSYNKVALERSSLLRTASDINPALKPLTTQLDELHASIKKAMSQAKNTLEIQKKSISGQYNKYQGQILSSPGQQRMMAEIGRQQEVQTALYTLLLQKREENSISLAATADKGKLIDRVLSDGKVKPKKMVILAIALFLGILIPLVVLILKNLLRYRIEGHEDVEKLTSMPIIADVPVANDKEKTIGEIIVHENNNSIMEEIFRSMRTNLQFILQEGQKVILSTSSIAGEGKTFITSNLAVSFALLGKKVILIGLDIRKPRLSDLFNLHEPNKGITPLLTLQKPTKSDVMSQVINSQVNKNLDLMMAGPVPPNPTELLARPQLEDVFAILKEEYDYILIDTAPVGIVTDTLLIGRVADASICVVRADYTPKESISMLEGIHQDEKLPSPAIVINGIDMSQKKHGYYYGYGKYGHYGKYGRHHTHYGKYSSYGSYGTYGNYSRSKYGNRNDESIKIK